MTAKPDFVTFTGLDEWTDLDRVLTLSNRYPVEWGVLFSPALQGRHPRYPSLAVVHRIVDGLPGNMATTAAHLCGGHADEVVSGGTPEIGTLLKGAFERYQVNTRYADVDPAVVGDFARGMGGTGILQCGSHFPDDVEVEWLTDASGGRGLLPPSWPSPPVREGVLVGYAGGLGPDNVPKVLAEVAPRHDDRHPFWIDMESGVRTDDRLDLDRCEAVCRAVFGD